MDHLLADLEQVQQRLKELEQVIAQRCGASEGGGAPRPRCRAWAHFTAMSLACRVGRVERFPRAHSLANYWGLTPGCRNSGENNQRLGSITKAGSAMARWLLAQVMHKVLAEGRPAAGVVQTDQAPAGSDHRPRGRDAEAGHDHLAHAEQTEDVCRVPSTRGTGPA